MPLDERISNLLMQWEDAREQGYTLTPEELCRDCPELLAEVERHVEALCKIASLLDSGHTDAETPSQATPLTRQKVLPTLTGAKRESRYTPTQLHRTGGLGEVYKAHDEELRRDVALKQIKEELTNNATCRREFLREAEITAKLEHPGVVPIYGLVQGPDGNPAYAMRFVEGESLRDAISRFHQADQGPRDPGERILALRQLLSRFIAVCNTLAFAHNRGIIHRDLKPANIMLGKYGETLVVDWGLARPFDRTETERASGEATLRPTLRDGETPDGTRLGEIKGTPSYMSPEQAEGMWESVGPASDIYSLGATLYELLTGAAPVRGRNGRDIILKVRRGEFPPPRAIKPSIPKPLEAICLRAMALTPADRYQKADDLAKDLETWLADEPVAAYREPWLVRQRRSARRHRLLVTSLAAAILASLLIGGGGLGWWLWRNRVQQQLIRQDVEPLLALTEEILRHPEKDPRDAGHLLDKAQARMADGGPAELQARLEARQRDLEMAKRLEAASHRATSLANGRFDFRGGDRAYAVAFADFGLDVLGTSSQEVPGAVRASLISDRLITALDYWAFCKDKTAPEGGAELRTVADSADDDAWRRRLRSAVRTGNPVELKQLTRDETSLNQPPSNLTLLAAALLAVRNTVAAENWLRKANERHPQDFSINFLLAYTLEEKVPPEPAEAMYFLQAALALQPDNPAVYNERGNAWLDRKDYDRSMRDYDEAIRLDSGYSVAFANRGDAWYAKKDYERAIRDYDEALRLDPKLVTALVTRGNTRYAKKDYDPAIRDYDEAIRIDPKLAMAFVGRGNVWREMKDYDQAVRDYDEALRVDPSFASAFFGRGNVWYDKKDYDRAIRDYDAALRLDSNLATAFIGRGNAWREKKGSDQAIRDYDEAIRLDPSLATAFVARGNAWRDKMDYEHAMRDYGEAIRLDPSYALAFNNRGIIWYDKKDYDQAIRDFDEAIRLDPHFAGAFVNRGNAWREKKDFDQAMRDYDEAIRLDPDLALAFSNRAYAWSAKKDYDRCIRDYTESIHLDPNDPSSFCNRGYAWAAKKDYDLAILDYDEAIRLGPELASAFNSRGYVFGGLKEYARAEADFRKAVQLSPNFVEAWENLGGSLKDQGRFAEARDALRTGLELAPKSSDLHQRILKALDHCERLLLLDRRVSEVLQGEDRAVGPNERIDLARLCQQYRQQYAAAARFYSEAFEARPDFANDTLAGLRYDAARAAALAGGGQGKDADTLDDKDGARLRNQARDWLRDDLALWGKAAESKKAEDRAMAEQILKRWQQDPDLAGIRDENAVAKLPPDEQERCKKLWANVAALLKQAQEKGE
jgi:tetratricopeptide (TPR) repeat protein/tRNA A-37 threonylcarbamoyl transferase component Bud32